MASPASDPANQTSKIAGTFSFSQFKVNGRPLNKTNATGLPVATNAFNKRFCASGISIIDFEALSPLLSAPSPIAATITSAFALTANASLIISSALRLSRAISLPNIV